MIDQENSMGKNADTKAQQISDQVSMSASTCQNTDDTPSAYNYEQEAIWSIHQLLHSHSHLELSLSNRSGKFMIPIIWYRNFILDY